jgi:mRNA-degrading endonuclease toxin of MazEF toxin-antitoxin module
MENIQRGGIYRVELTTGMTASVLVVGRDALNQASDYVLIAPLVEIARVEHSPLPCHVVVSGVSPELDNEWVIVCEFVRPIHKAHLQSLVGQTPPHTQAKVNNALQIVFALDS